MTETKKYQYRNVYKPKLYRLIFKSFQPNIEKNNVKKVFNFKALI